MSEIVARDRSDEDRKTAAHPVTAPPDEPAEAPEEDPEDESCDSWVEDCVASGAGVRDSPGVGDPVAEEVGEGVGSLGSKTLPTPWPWKGRAVFRLQNTAHPHP